MTLRPERILENNALAHAECFTLDAPPRRMAVVVARLTWSITPDGVASVALEPRPVRIPTSWNGHSNASMRFASDLATDKPGTDVVLLGHAHPPVRRPGASLPTAIDVSFRLEAGHRTLAKAVRVFGRRVFMRTLRGVEPGPAAPLLEPVPLVYELAEGGVDPDADPSKRKHPDNPAGSGYGRGLRADRAAVAASERALRHDGRALLPAPPSRRADRLRRALRELRPP